MKKKALIGLGALLISFSLASCGANKTTSSSVTEPSVTNGMATSSGENNDYAPAKIEEKDVPIYISAE